MSLHNNTNDIDVVPESAVEPDFVVGFVAVTTKYVNVRGAVCVDMSEVVHCCVPDRDCISVPGGTAVSNCFSDGLIVCVTIETPIEAATVFDVDDVVCETPVGKKNSCSSMIGGSFDLAVGGSTPC